MGDKAKVWSRAIGWWCKFWNCMCGCLEQVTPKNLLRNGGDLPRYKVKNHKQPNPSARNVAKKLYRDLNAHVQQSLKKCGNFLHPKNCRPTFRKPFWEVLDFETWPLNKFVYSIYLDVFLAILRTWPFWDGEWNRDPSKGCWWPPTRK